MNREFTGYVRVINEGTRPAQIRRVGLTFTMDEGNAYRYLQPNPLEKTVLEGESANFPFKLSDYAECDFRDVGAFMTDFTGKHYAFLSLFDQDVFRELPGANKSPELKERA
jgi:hypothetical protein